MAQEGAEEAVLAGAAGAGGGGGSTHEEGVLVGGSSHEVGVLVGRSTLGSTLAVDGVPESTPRST